MMFWDLNINTSKHCGPLKQVSIFITGFVFIEVLVFITGSPKHLDGIINYIREDNFIRDCIVTTAAIEEKGT